jgi:4'-phosphopantetheinyl transferase
MTNPFVRPASHDVHLWTIDLEGDDAEAASYRMAATSEEQVHARSYRNPDDGRRYVAAHGALRIVLSGYLQCQPRDISIRKTEEGKPFVEHTTLQFNLSHGGTTALIAVSDGRRVGVDVERLRHIPDEEAILPMIASDDERASFALLESADRVSEFFRLWTRTEALCKVTGIGLSESFEPCRELLPRCKLVHVGDLDGYAACVAAEGFDWKLVRKQRHPELIR